MLKEDYELKFELLKIILANPANKISEMDADDVIKKVSVFIQDVRDFGARPKEKP